MYKTTMQETANRKILEQKGNITIFEYDHDMSTNVGSAMQSYYASKMNVRKRQVMVNLDDKHDMILQAGAMQWIAGDVSSATNVKGIGDFAKN